MAPLFYYSFNAELMATSLKYTHWSDARKAAERLSDKYPTRYRWVTMSNQPPLSPDQCCGWMKDLPRSSPSPSLGMSPTGADDDDLYMCI